MHCATYCTAESYPIPALETRLKQQWPTTLYRDVVHATLAEGSDVFFFSYGVVICWGLSEEQELRLIDQVRPLAHMPMERIERDRFRFDYGEALRVHRDEILLPARDGLTKLAISYALAQSVKLSGFEETINNTIELTKHLPKELARKGRISLSRREISQKIGELFIERSSVNLHTDILELPEFFWEYGEYEPFYRQIANYLDIAARVDVLNKRLTIVNELLSILNDQLNHQHSSTLEWTIIWLIVIEVVLALLRDLFHLI